MIYFPDSGRANIHQLGDESLLDACVNHFLYLRHFLRCYLGKMMSKSVRYITAFTKRVNVMNSVLLRGDYLKICHAIICSIAVFVIYLHSLWYFANECDHDLSVNLEGINLAILPDTCPGVAIVQSVPFDTLGDCMSYSSETANFVGVMKWKYAPLLTCQFIRMESILFSHDKSLSRLVWLGSPVDGNLPSDSLFYKTM